MTKVKSYKEIEDNPQVLGEPVAEYYTSYATNGFMDTTLQDVYLGIPQSEMNFFKELVKKMGWIVYSKEMLLEKFIATRPTDVDLTDDDIMEELYKVRYDK